ncbi:hypothetical protein SAMIE_1020990 [Sphingobium amiense]|uniref:Outer membrane protein beta-barrel domain-containing protein n=1 Tax=Sphingobium amiense TaxID=135719 RepID=A0A494W5Y3_9SPHN|nr:hypothetical protein [Sphingobium amiense]BBD98598.1 hypothetical protein SAMIE_1020990 [Sphingobium amiense]
MKFLAVTAATAAALLSAPAFAAQDDDARLYAGITGGTLGIGPEVGYRLSKNIGIRANASFLSISHGFESDDIEYDGKVKLQSFGAMLDVYPFGGGFRLSGGFRINGNKARATAEPSGGTYDINGTTYTAAEIGTLRANTDIKNFAPALTLGYGGGLSSGFVFGVEAGALFQGRVRIKPLTYTGTLDSAELRADLEAERQSVQDDIDGYKVYPILQLTIGYRF